MSKKDTKKAIESAATIAKLKAEKDALAMRLHRAETAAEERREAAATPPPAAPAAPVISERLAAYRKLREGDAYDKLRAQVMIADDRALLDEADDARRRGV